MMNGEKSVGASKSIFARRSIFVRSASEQGTESSRSSGVDLEELEETMSSPVTNLTFNLQVLSTHGAEPKFVRRKLSLTSSSFSESSEDVSPPFLQRNFSADDGCCLDSPGSDCRESMSYDSPFLQNWELPPLEAKCQGRASGFKRFNSVPTFDVPRSARLKTTFSLTSVKEVDTSRGVENVKESKRGGENKENEEIGGEPGCKKSVSFKLPTSPAPRRIISPFKDETNSPIFSRGTMCSGGTVDQSNSDLAYKSPKMSAKAYSRQLHRTLSRKLSSDDGFLEKLQDDGESCDRQAVPKGLEGLFFSPVLEMSESESSPAPHDPITFSGDAMDGSSECSASLVRGLFRSPSAPKLIQRKYSAQDIRISYKRSESHNQDADLTPLQLKRWKGGLGKEERDNDAAGGVGGAGGVVAERRITPRRIMRCHSETEIFIKTALSWADSQQNLIGDFTKPFCLPLVCGKHQDLKAISADTMAAIVNDDYKDVMEECIVVDCRYPYEFNGGHIPGARNVYTTDDLNEMFFSDSSRESDRRGPIASSSSSPAPSGSTEKRTIVIFHCEFSSERGPKLSRFLRNRDRDANSDSYPTLRYPEIYLLEGGYKSFHESFPHLCEPCGYVPMLHQDHLTELKQYRSKSSSWTTADKVRAVGRKTMARPSLNL